MSKTQETWQNQPIRFVSLRLLPGLMVSWGGGGGERSLCSNLSSYLVIGKKGKKQKCQQIQKKAKYLSVRESLSAGVTDSRMFVSCF